eukprot:351219-Chlamydomonas_euryale.AAC.5
MFAEYVGLCASSSADQGWGLGAWVRGLRLNVSVLDEQRHLCLAVVVAHWRDNQGSGRAGFLGVTGFEEKGLYGLWVAVVTVTSGKRPYGAPRCARPQGSRGGLVTPAEAWWCGRPRLPHQAARLVRVTRAPATPARCTPSRRTRHVHQRLDVRRESAADLVCQQRQRHGHVPRGFAHGAKPSDRPVTAAAAAAVAAVASAAAVAAVVALVAAACGADVKAVASGKAAVPVFQGGAGNGGRARPRRCAAGAPRAQS